MAQDTQRQPAADTTEQARRDLERAEAGDPTGAGSRDNDPAAEAAEQEAADGPGGRGLSR